MDDVRLYNRALSQLEVAALTNPTSSGTTGIAGIKPETFNVFPVPASDAVALVAPAAAFPVRYVLVTQPGQILRTGTLHSSSETVSLTDVAPGLYFLQVRGTTGEQSALRVLKN